MLLANDIPSASVVSFRIYFKGKADYHMCDWSCKWIVEEIFFFHAPGRFGALRLEKEET